MSFTAIKDTAYVELQCLSNFSFLRGASHPEELIRAAYDLNYKGLAITDECSLAAVVRAHKLASKLKFKLIIGAQFEFDEGVRLVLLANNKKAYTEISALITKMRRRTQKGKYIANIHDLDLLSDGLLIWNPKNNSMDKVWAGWLSDRFKGRTWIGQGLFYSGVDGKIIENARFLSKRYGLPVIAAGDVYMHVHERRMLQDTLSAIRFKKTLDNIGDTLHPNGEHYLRPLNRLVKIYPPEWLEETIVISESCQFELTELQYHYPRELTPDGISPKDHLTNLTYKGMKQRWPDGASKKVLNVLEHELKLIGELKYEEFFLTVYDIVKFARSRKILCQGRGSAANSAVCYCLGITEVDPERMEMLFERFVSKERNEPPDIDVDFEHERKEEVIQYIYQKYGRERAALAATVICYKARSAIKDVGKSLGFSNEQINCLTRSIRRWSNEGEVEKDLTATNFDSENHRVKLLGMLVKQILGFPRHLSQHVGGFVISDSLLSDLVPVENAAMPGRSVIQWDKDDLATLGLLKVDCLSLGMLSAIRKCFDLINKYDGRRLNIASIPAEDKATYKMIQRADTVGVFQIESRAQMAMLPRLKPNCFYDLVIEIAIIRPGPIQGEMVHPYLQRRSGKQEVNYPSEEVKNILERTLGVPLFQEQVIKLAMVAADFEPGEADQLRRSMAAWKRDGGITRFRKRLIKGMLRKGYKKTFAEQIFAQIEGFGEYGFPESHSASFALLAYTSSWLKCHETAAFTAALLNSQPMGFYAPSQLIQDAKRQGVEVRPVDVTVSEWDCSLETTEKGAAALRLGLRLIKGLKKSVAVQLSAARKEKEFDNIIELAERVKLTRAEIIKLSKAGALKSLGGNRHQSYWSALNVKEPLPTLSDQSVKEATVLLKSPDQPSEVLEDYSSLGLSLTGHPVGLLRSYFQSYKYVSASELESICDGELVLVSGLVISRQRPGTKTGVVFLTLEDETGLVNLIVWSSLVNSQRSLLLNAKLLGVRGRIQRESSVTHIIAQHLYDHSDLIASLNVHSRDFH